MKQIKTDVLVIGGGATGTGILRDLALRGFNCILVERRDLAYGTTGRFHGLLHSGGRYVVKDPQAAQECYQENLILRRIMPHCIEDTGGYFVQTPFDDPAYVDKFLAGASAAGIPVTEVEIRWMLKQEPLLSPSILRCFQVPDASADSFIAASLNADSARLSGASVLTYHEVSRLIVSPASPSGRPSVVGAVCHDLVKDEDVQIDAGMVINASGAWAGIVASMAGIQIRMRPGKGTMLALNHRPVDTVINRCKMPSDGDILVPAHTVAVIGTTDIHVSDPDRYSIEPWEISHMLDEGEKIIPSFKRYRILRAWAGVRPLVDEQGSGSDRDISRAYTLFDHAQRDGVEGLVTITGGKWTTYRRMAEVTVDKVCQKLGVERPCHTHLEVLPGTTELKPHYHTLGARLAETETQTRYGQLICECELAIRDEIINSIVNSEAKSIDDIRRDVRLGMGPCQGAFCALRAAGLLQEWRKHPVELTNASLWDFLQERWKGNLPILRGQQLRQARFTEYIYVDTLNAPHLPGQSASRLGPENYIPADNQPEISASPIDALNTRQKSGSISDTSDVLIIGAGLAGLIAGWRSTLRGCTTKVITQGWGSLYWGSGCIDLIGYEPDDSSHRISAPLDYLEKFVVTHPEHPYAILGIETLKDSLLAFQNFSQSSGLPYLGSAEKNLLLPTALGTIRPTCLAPASMVAGDFAQKQPMLIVGFEPYLDFYPALVAANLNAQGYLAEPISLDLAKLRERKFVTGINLARLFDDPQFRADVIQVLKPKVGSMGRIGFPAVLGLQKSMEALQHLESELGVQVFEIPGLPPSIPGMRLHHLLVAEIERRHGSVFNGMQVIQTTLNGQSIEAVWSRAAARDLAHTARTFILATGGVLGGGITTSPNGNLQEMVFNLPLDSPASPSDSFRREFLTERGHPIFRSGVQVDKSFHPIGPGQNILYDNLMVIGSLLGGCDPIRERSLEGIALTSGFRAGDGLLEINHHAAR